MTVTARILDNTLAYRLWQAPFAEVKFAPIVTHNDLRAVRRVLDVGCGPGTNTRHFTHTEYLGLDVNPRYVAHARRRWARGGCEFRVADVTAGTASRDQRFDFILLNSLLHHVATPDVRRLLTHLATLLTPDGHVHILDLVLAPAASPARLLARWDRGEFPRPLAEWQAIFTTAFEAVVFEPYRLRALGITLWHMVYFKGRARA